ncbi:MAG: T9SS type A sorting domain-containing protein [Acidaminococcaceae bacterium]
MLDSLMIDIVFNNYIQKYADPNHMHGRIRNELVNASDTYDATVNGYTEGLGSIRYTRTTYTSTYRNDLIYYKKGEEEWGSYTPISIDEQYVKNSASPISQMLADNFTKTGIKKDKPDLNTIVQHKGKQVESKEPCSSCLPGGIVFRTQTQIDEFHTNYPECTNIEGDVTIWGFDIANLNGLNMLTSIGGNFRVFACYTLTSLNGLDSLTSIEGNLEIIANNSLTSLSGIENLEAASIDQLTIINNSSLSSCEAQWLCEYLSSPNSEFELSNNASGCNSIIEVAAGCGGMPCLTDDDYVFNTQSEIDLFEAAFPNCTDLEGNVTINGIDITNLAGLGMITSIAGNLTIHGCEGLTSLTGLDNLNSVGNDLIIYKNYNLSSLNGTENLYSVGGNLKLYSLPDLSSLNGLDGLNNIGVNFRIYNCNTLTSLTGLENLTSIGGYLWIDHNAGLSNLNGMENLTSVDGNLWIHTNTALTSLSGLENLTSVGKNFRLFFNTALTSLSGLESLTSIGDYLWVKNNPVLTSLSGLDNLNTIGDYLWVDDNKVLSHLNGLEGLNSIEGNFWFTGNDSLSELPELNSLTSIGGNLWVNYNITLTSLSGLDNLEAASIDQLIIVHNSSLSSCEAQWLCEYLSSPNSEFEISNNASGCNSIIEVAAGCGGMPCLTNDDYVFNTQLEIDLFEAAFPNCTDLEGNVTINGIDITNLAGLGMITSIAGNLTIHGCDGLTSLTGLDNLSSVGNDLNINNNNVLASLNGLEDLSTIGANLKIENNDFLYNLTSLEGLTSIEGNLQIIENDTLTSLRGLDNLEAASITDLQIVSNPLLEKCEVNSICNYLSEPGGTIEIHDNAPGCSNPQQVENACEKLDVEELAVEAEFMVFPNPAKNKIYLTSKNDLKIETFTIYNQIGQKVFHRNETVDNIDISALESGIYFLELISGELTIKQKLIVSN